MKVILIRKALVDFALQYSQNTSIHGFRYLHQNPHWSSKAFWILSITLAFISCGVLILSNWKEIQENPTITTRDEVGLDDFPLPAISILVPEIDSSRYADLRMANSIRACDPKVNISKSEKFRDYLVATKTMHDLVRKAFKPSTSEVIKFGESLKQQNMSTYTRFCTMAIEMPTKDREMFMQKVNDRVDSYLLVNDLSEVLKDSLGDVMVGTIHEECNVIGGQLNFTIVEDWMKATAPLAFKGNQGFACNRKWG